MDPPAADEPGRDAAGGGSGSLERRLRRHALAARTVAVSFRAAMVSTRRHLNLPDDERAAIKEHWRAWALEALEGYERELDRLVAAEPLTGDGATEALRDCREELERSFEMVRSTEGD